MRYGFFLLFLFNSWNTNAQVIILGSVKDNRNKPLGGVSITLKDTYDGSTSDSTGSFLISTEEKGAFLILISLSGYESKEIPLLLSDSSISLDIRLNELVTELKAVVLTAGAFEAGDHKKTTVLSSLDIVTTASANGDVTGAIKTLPGAQQVGESTGLFVRGGTATESKIYIDGSLVNNFFYATVPGIASRGRFNPFLFQGTVFSSGGYSALYGQAMSSALILESKDLPERTQGDLSFSVIGGGGGIQKLSKNKKASWGLSYYYTNLKLAFDVIKQRQDYFKAPVNHTADANFRFKTKRGLVKYYGYGSFDKVGLRTADIDSVTFKNAFNLQNVNTYHNISWKERLNQKWKLQAAISYSNNKDNIRNEFQDENHLKTLILDPVAFAFKNFRVETQAHYGQARLVLEKRGKGMNALRFGGDQFFTRENLTYTMFDENVYKQTINDRLSALFIEKDFYITNDIAARFGGRAEYSSLLSKWNIAPRASLAYKFKSGAQASFAYGIFHQSPETKYLPSSNLDGYSNASHYILQYQKISNKKTFRAEIFYKDYNRLVKTQTDFTGREVVYNNNGYGYAKGIEFFWRDKATVKNFDYWVSYSFLDTKREFLTFPHILTPSFAARHTASLVVKKFVLPWKTGFNGSYNFATGRPYYNFVQSGNNQYEISDRGRTIDYHNFSFSVNYLPKLGDQNSKSFAVWVLSISNVFGNNQIYGYNYSGLSDRKVAILPPSRRFIYIGYFLSFGLDRTEDVINNNL